MGRLNSGVRFPIILTHTEAQKVRMSRQLSTPKAAALYFFALVLLTALASRLIHEAGSVPGAVSLVLGGLLAAPSLGFVFGRLFGRAGVVAAVWGGSVLASALFVFTLATAPSLASFVILSALGFWSIPFFGVASSFLGVSMSPRHLGGAPN